MNQEFRDKITAKIAELEAEMNSTNFWTDKVKAQEVISEIKKYPLVAVLGMILLSASHVLQKLR